MALVFARVAATASTTVSNTGMPSTSCPPLPGVTPATTWVPADRFRRLWNRPCSPVRPCTTRRVDPSIRTAIGAPAASPSPGGRLRQLRRHEVGAGAAADVQEVRRPAPRLGDHVERGHDEAGAVPDDPHLAVELHVLQAELLGPRLGRVDREGGPEGLDLRLALERVVVD